jgi:hypothetical protein
MKNKILIGLAIAFSMIATPAFAVEEENNGTPLFSLPKVQEYTANYFNPITRENVVGFLGNKNAKGTLSLGVVSGVYTTQLKDNVAVYHSFVLPKTLTKGSYFAKGCIEFGAQTVCGREFVIRVK